MSEEATLTPPRFAFDEFYKMLHQYVNNPEARSALATYDAEDVAGRGELATPTDRSVCSELAYESFHEFERIGFQIMYEHGWPTYSQIVKTTTNDPERRQDLCKPLYDFRNIALRLIQKHDTRWSSSFRDEDFDINNRVSVLKLLKMWAERHPSTPPYYTWPNG
ncbi:hypothetical protein [Sphingopyxis sp.]|uniref:hypothetical protein n=1 Tax=Sphingopyxis sp. TaxID=1908224 RepID=UPI003D11CFE6